MQQVSETYKRILAGNHWFENSVTLGNSGVLVDENGNTLLFGSDRLLVDMGGPESGFKEDKLFDVKTNSEVFKDGTPGIGTAVSAYTDITMIAQYNIPHKARIGVYIRAVNENEKSEWIPQGTFFIDTREQTQDDRGFDVLTIKGYDAMLLSEVPYPSDNQNDYPLLDKSMVQFIADNMKPDVNGSGISVDSRTWDVMTAGYKFPLPVGYSMREVLCMIAAAYGGSFVISPAGELRLVSMFDLPAETRYLITENGFRISFGGDYLLA